MDCSMPVMDGYEASDMIRHFLSQRNMPQPMIIATTGHTENEYINKCWVHSIDEVISKPININIIKSVLDDIIISEWLIIISLDLTFKFLRNYLVFDFNIIAIIIWVYI